jgi:GntR family transcriptional regulator
VRELAEQLGINLQTVAKAYAELTRSGVLEARRGLGTFVAQRSARTSDRHARALVRAKLLEARRLAEAAGLERDDVEALLEAVWRAEAKTCRR